MRQKQIFSICPYIFIQKVEILSQQALVDGKYSLIISSHYRYADKRM